MLVLCVLLLVFLFNKVFFDVDPGFIRRWLLSWGWWAPLIFLIMFIIRPFTFFPASLLAITGGLAFGAWHGFLYTMIGSFSGAILSFWVVRKLRKRFIKKEWPDYTRKLQRELERRGFLYVLFVRLIPVLGFEIVTYLAALSKVRFLDYFFGTLLGIIPGAFGYTFLGSSIASGDFHLVIIAFAVLLVILVIPLWIRKRMK
jgi:uncharacterized membrane protein YdjX (TVP38/TMEM64 family)